MKGDKFDFHVAADLVQTIESAASVLEIKNEEMATKFGKLNEGFKDDGYDELIPDMSAANQAIKAVNSQLHSVSKHIADYAVRLRDES